MQLAGHLKERALQEYNLLRAEERESFESAVEALCSHLDPGSKAGADQDFRHATQKDSESVADFVRQNLCSVSHTAVIQCLMRLVILCYILSVTRGPAL